MDRQMNAVMQQVFNQHLHSDGKVKCGLDAFRITSHSTALPQHISKSENQYGNL
jgi:hypothetical protein